jgi:predicted aspartyl protease
MPSFKATCNDDAAACEQLSNAIRCGERVGCMQLRPASPSTMSHVSKLQRVVLLAALLACMGTAEASPSGTTRLATDSVGHFTADVMLNDTGPFRFVVDTGAQYSVLSHKAAIALNLRPVGTVSVTGASGAQVASVVTVRDYRSDLFSLHGEEMALMPDDSSLDSDGILGMNTFASSRIEFDFEKGVFTVGASGASPDGFIVQPGSVRMSSFLVVDVVVDGVHASALIDTGSGQTIANPQLRAALGLGADDPRLLDEPSIHGVTIHTTPARKATLNRLSIGDVSFSRPLVTFADLPVFHGLGLDHGPAMIIGVDQLSVLGGVAIDYPRAELQLRP